MAHTVSMLELFSAPKRSAIEIPDLVRSSVVSMPGCFPPPLLRGGTRSDDPGSPWRWMPPNAVLALSAPYGPEPIRSLAEESSEPSAACGAGFGRVRSPSAVGVGSPTASGVAWRRRVRLRSTRQSYFFAFRRMDDGCRKEQEDGDQLEMEPPTAEGDHMDDQPRDRSKR